MNERMTGSDAVLLHMEDEHTPMHTLKIVVLDPARRGRPLHLDELALAVGSHLGLVPRATQKVVAAPGFGGRPFWVDDPDFDLRAHLDERTLPAPGTQRELDAVYGDLASTMLPRDRALWAMTLVHGLEGGRQAVVVRVHHAIVDGLGALNAFVAATSAEPGATAGITPAATAVVPSLGRLAGAAFADTVRTWKALPSIVRDATAARRRSRDDENPDIPRFLVSGRSSLNAAGDATRVCASASLDLATVKAIGKAAGVTVNGVLHAAIAGAIRTELAMRGENVDEPTMAAFGIATDTANSDRLHGNHVTPTFVRLRSDLVDVLERLEATARSCTAAVEARRAAGLHLSDRLSAYAPRALNGSRRVLARRTELSPAHIVTANVPGPQHRRWLGDIEVVDWFSFAVGVAPATVNLTVHSYDGRMNMGLVADPAAMPEPERFLELVAGELQTLADVALPAAQTTKVA